MLSPLTPGRLPGVHPRPAHSCGTRTLMDAGSTRPRLHGSPLLHGYPMPVARYCCLPGAGTRTFEPIGGMCVFFAETVLPAYEVRPVVELVVELVQG